MLESDSVDERARPCRKCLICCVGCLVNCFCCCLRLILNLLSGREFRLRIIQFSVGDENHQLLFESLVTSCDSQPS